MTPDFEKSELLPAVVQDAATGAVRMLGYMNREALEATLETGDLHFFSRSRNRLWKKGETSGNIHRVRCLSVDCDGDALLVQVVPEGPTCHTGSDSCFFNPIQGPDPASGTLDRLEQTIRSRLEERPEGSYTAQLAEAGPEQAARKVGEEAVEVVVAALAEGDDALLAEAADLVYHLLLLLNMKGVRLADLLGELDRRAGGEQ